MIFTFHTITILANFYKICTINYPYLSHTFAYSFTLKNLRKIPREGKRLLQGCIIGGLKIKTLISLKMTLFYLYILLHLLTYFAKRKYILENSQIVDHLGQLSILYTFTFFPTQIVVSKD